MDLTNLTSNRLIISRRSLIGGAAGLGLVLIGCGSEDDAGGTVGGDGSAGAGSPSGSLVPPTMAEVTLDPNVQMTDATLRAAIGSGPGSLDPQAVPGTGGGNWPNYTTHFGSWLITTDETRRPDIVYVPWYAAEVPTVSDDHMTWTIKLAEGLTFHNGDPATAEDVKFSFDRQLGKAAYNPEFKAGYASQFRSIDNVEVVDPSTVKVHFSQPDVSFTSRLLLRFYTVPKKYIEEVGDEVFAAKPVGLGPFKFVSHQADAELVSERFDQYHPAFGSAASAASGMHPPFIKRLEQRIIPDDQARIAALQAGEVDLVSNIAADIGKQLAAEGEYTVNYLQGDQPLMISMNLKTPTDPSNGQPNPFLDKRVRLAANYAVDVDAIIQNVLTGYEEHAYGASTLGLGFPKDLPSKRFPYDPEKAKQLLAEAGYPDGFDTTMVGPIGRWPNSRAVMEAASGYLQEVGIRAPVSESQYQEVVQQIQAGTFSLLGFWSTAGGADPGPMFRDCYHSQAGFSMGGTPDQRKDGTAGPDDTTAHIDRLIEQSEQEFDPAKRTALLEQIITDYYLTGKNIYIFQPTTIVALTKSFNWDVHFASQVTPEYWNIQPAS